MTLVTGDPASCSRVGGSLRQLATALRTNGRATHTAIADPALQRPGTVVARARRRLTGLDDAATVAAHELDRVGSALQDHAADLAEAGADVRAVVARAESAGLRVADGRLAPAWGVSGVADGPADATREEQREALQSELDRLLAVLAARRHRLAATMAASSSLLADHATALRR
ncbi:MAG: hypothetical protein ABIQ13_02815 [Pedococcus sp.]